MGKQITILFYLKSLWPAPFVENGSPARFQYSHEEYIWISDVIVGSCFVLQTMRVKLQPPSGSELPGYNPILPPSAITQVMLIANPAKVSSVIAKLAEWIILLSVRKASFLFSFEVQSFPCWWFKLRKVSDSGFWPLLVCFVLFCHGVPRNKIWPVYLSLLKRLFVTLLLY